MSWVFLAGDRVFKLKKPVRFAYLDFSTLARREEACRAELKLNRRLAPDVYLSVMPLVWTPRGLAIGGSGFTVDWLVVCAGSTRPQRWRAWFSIAVLPLEILTASS
jgi:aminoglycoside phosphotransferase family enzyme